MTSIVFSVCEKHFVSPDEFFGKLRSRRLVACRRDAIFALREAGFSIEACARMIRRNQSTVQYWLDPGIRKHRRKKMKRTMRLKRWDLA